MGDQKYDLRLESTGHSIAGVAACSTSNALQQYTEGEGVIN